MGAKQSRSLTVKELPKKSPAIVNTIPLHGISVRWFLSFLKSDAEFKKKLSSKKYKTKDLVIRIKALTKVGDESLAEMLMRTDPSKVKEKADIFVSHAWDYLVKDVHDSLEDYLLKSGKEDLFMWFDALIMNQHKAGRNEYDTDFWSKTFHKAINDIGRTVVIMTPWDAPYNLTRSWCLWEIYGSTLYEETIVDIVIVPNQREVFRKALRKNAQDLAVRMGPTTLSCTASIPPFAVRAASNILCSSPLLNACALVTSIFPIRAARSWAFFRRAFRNTSR